MSRSKTPPAGIQTQEDRDLAALKKRRQSSVHDVPNVPDFVEDEEGTSPVSLIERGESRNSADLHAIQDRYDHDPAFRALWNMMRRQRRESNRTLGKVADAAGEVHSDITKLRELGEKLGDLDGWKREVDVMLRITKWILGVVLVTTLGSLIVIGTKIYTWGVGAGELEIRLQHLERAMERRNTQNNYNYPAPASVTPSPTPARIP